MSSKATYYGGISQNKNYILTHGVSRVDWRFYKHPLPEHVYDVYMQYWQDVELAVDDKQRRSKHLLVSN